MENDEDLEYMKQLVAEYDVVVPALNEQLHYYKGEYSSLKRDIVNLSQENKVLYQKLEECASNHMAATPYSFNENDFIDNLKNQLNLSIKEKESVVELWRTSMTRIDFLESELKLYSAGSESANKSFIRKVKKTYENEVKNLRSKLRESQTKLQEATSISKTSLENKQDELEILNRNQQDLIEKMKKLTDDLNDSHLKIGELTKFIETLKGKLSKETKKLEQVNLDNYNAKLKVAEACHIIEAALIEKDAALLRENEAREEIAKLSTTINEIVQETESKIKQDIAKVKEDYANKLHSYKLDLKKCQEDLAIKTMEFDKRCEWCALLQNEIDQLKEGKTKTQSKVYKDKQAWNEIVEQHREKLINCERKNAQLKLQLKEFQESVVKSKQLHDDQICSMQMEKKSLETHIHTLENDLQLSNSRFHQVNCKVEDLGKRIGAMDLQFKEELALKNAENERAMVEKLSEVECVNARINEELKTQLSTQINLNQKWKFEVRNVTEKLENKIHALKSELVKVKSKNTSLTHKLEHSECKRMEYKENLKTLCEEFNTIANIKV